MKLVAANGKEYLQMTKNEWEKMGKEAGWGMDLLKTIVDPITKSIQKAVEPEATYAPTRLEDEDRGSFVLDEHLEDQRVMETPASKIDINEISRKYQGLKTADPDLLLAFHKALEFISIPSSPQKTVDGMKMVLFRIVNLTKANNNRKQSEDILKKWYKQKMEWEKPKSPYV